MVIGKDGNIQAKEFTVEGRKIPLDEIRRTTLMKYKKSLGITLMNIMMRCQG
jgi:hypothetical protein